MYVETSGPADAPAILLIHGGGVAGWMWRAQVEVLARDYRVIVPDLPGHGRSASEPYTTQQEVAEALAAVLEDEGVTDVAVVGFSLGGQLAVQLASSRSDLVSRVVVVSCLIEPIPFARLSTWMLGVAAPLARSERFARAQAKQLFIPAELLDDYVATSVSMSKGDLLALSRANFSFRMPAAWADFPGRALIIAGTREPRAVRASMAALHAALPGSELELVEGAGHGISLQRPKWFTELLRRWLPAG